MKIRSGLLGIENDRVQAHPARARLPLRTGAMAAQPGKFLPGLAAIGGAENRRVFHPGINRIRIRKRWLQMPYALEFPWMLRAVIPLVGSEGLATFGPASYTNLLLAAFGGPAGRGLSSRGSWLVPRLAAIVRALNDLSEPSAGLRGINTIWIYRRSLQVIHFPAGKMRTAHIPIRSLAIRCQE